MIDLSIHEAALERTIQRAREQNIIIPTFAQQRNPEPVSYTHLTLPTSDLV